MTKQLGTAIRLMAAVRRHIEEECSPRKAQLFLEIGMQSQCP
jgi:hypothetical protein